MLLCVTALAVLAFLAGPAAGRLCFVLGPPGGPASAAARTGVARRAEPQGGLSEAQRKALRLPNAEERAELESKWAKQEGMEDMYNDGGYDKMDPFQQGVYMVGACGVAVIWLPLIARALDSVGLTRPI